MSDGQNLPPGPARIVAKLCVALSIGPEHSDECVRRAEKNKADGYTPNCRCDWWERTEVEILERWERTEKMILEITGQLAQ